MFYWVLVGLFVLSVLFLSYCLPNEISEAISKIPGPNPIPFIGNSNIFNASSKDKIKLLKKLQDTYGDRVRFWQYGTPTVVLYKGVDVEAFLSKNPDRRQSTIYEYIKPSLHGGFPIGSLKKWNLYRTQLTSAFRFQMLNNYNEITYRYSDILTQVLELLSRKGQSFNIYPYITSCVMNIVCEIVTGDQQYLQEYGKDYGKAIFRISELASETCEKCSLGNLFKIAYQSREYNRLLKVINCFGNKVIEKRKKTFKQILKKVKDFKNLKKEKLSYLDLLLEVGQRDLRISDQDIREEMDTFIFEGYHSTANAIYWCLFLLGKKPELQEKICEEVNSTMHFTDTSERLKELNLLDRCINETLRLYPSVPIYRTAVTSPVELEGLTIPPGCDVTIPIFLTQRDPEVFSDPEMFKLARKHFCLTNHRPNGYFPFGFGPRSMINDYILMFQTKLVLCKILSKFKIQSFGHPEEIQGLCALTLKPDRPIKTIITLRHR